MLFGFALVLALCAAFVARSLLQPHVPETTASEVAAREEAEKAPPVWVAVTAETVSPGSFISPDAIKWIEVPAEKVPVAAYSAKNPSLVARSSRRILESPMAQAIGLF